MAAFNQGQYNLTANPLTGAGTYGEGQISDAVSRLQQLQGALQSGQIDYNTYQTLFNQFDPSALSTYNSIAGGGSKAASAAEAAGGSNLTNLSTQGGTDLNTFASQLKNLTGQGPSATDIQNYFTNIAPQLKSNTSYADANSMINQYLSNQYQPQIKQYQQQQQTSALDSEMQQVQDLINRQNQATVSNLTSPQVMDQFKGAYNNSGLLDSGAFSQGLGQTLGNAANQNISQSLGAVGLPALNGMFNTSSAPYESFLQNLNPNTQTAGQNQNSLNEWYMNKDLADQMAGGSQSGIQQWMPIISSLIGAGGQLGSAGIMRGGIF